MGGWGSEWEGSGEWQVMAMRMPAAGLCDAVILRGDEGVRH